MSVSWSVFWRLSSAMVLMVSIGMRITMMKNISRNTEDMSAEEPVRQVIHRNSPENP